LLLKEDLALFAGRVDAGKLGFAVQFAFFAPASPLSRRRGGCGAGGDRASRCPDRMGHGDAGWLWPRGRSGHRHSVANIDHQTVAAFYEAAEDEFSRSLADDVLPSKCPSSELED
jgi:hypothetical protein